MSADKFDPARTYVLEETVRTKPLTLEQLADIAVREEDSSDLDFAAALEPHKTQAKGKKE